MQIVNAQEADLQPLAQLFDQYRAFYSQPSDLKGAHDFLTARISAGDSKIWLAESQDQKLGFLQVYPTFSSIGMGHVWLINDLFVHPLARRRGVAKTLLETCLKEAAEQGVRLVRISTEHTNTAAAKLYLDSGFEKDLRFQHFNYFTPRESL